MARRPKDNQDLPYWIVRAALVVIVAIVCGAEVAGAIGSVI